MNLVNLVAKRFWLKFAVMFTGIVEATGIIKGIETRGTNTTFIIESGISGELKTDQSVNHNGVCLTVEVVNGNFHQVTAIDETLKKTHLGSLKTGDRVNLERCLTLNGRLDGHIVQGHVDSTAKCLSVIEKTGSHEFEFEFDKNFSPLVIEKGSICINGISLTVFNVGRNRFTVAIIPYTFENTNTKFLQAGDLVNIEFDVIGKYILRSEQLRSG